MIGCYYKDIDSDSELSITKRSNQANAIRIHPNFTPTMILFNSHNYLADLNLDGIFDYQAIMNAQLISAAYRYEDSTRNA